MSAPVRFRVMCLVGMIIALAAAVRAEEPSRQTLAKAGKAATVYVQVKDGSGSGFCIHPSGLFLTNHHVIAGGGDISLVLNANQKDQQVVKAQVVRSDRDADLALLQAEEVKGLPALELGSDDKITEGDDVVACGFPLGKGLALAQDEYPAVTVTFGRVTALRQKAGELELIQTDIELHPGNSGGPILGTDGKVAGVTVAGVKGTAFRLAIPHPALAERVGHASALLALLSPAKGRPALPIAAGPRRLRSGRPRRRVTVFETGKVTWDVPKDAAAGFPEVRVRLQDASGRVVVHSFRVRVDDN
jgi:S1-C subfamily serine protease